MASCYPKSYVTRDDMQPFCPEWEALVKRNIICVPYTKDNPVIYLPIEYQDTESHLREVKLHPDSWVNGLVGLDRLVSKKYLAETLNSFWENTRQMIPDSYTNWESIPPDSDRKWVLKEDVQCQKGLKLVVGDPRKHITSKTRVVQSLAENALMWNGLKVNFRVYLLLVKTRNKPLVGLFSTLGFVYYSKNWITTGYCERDIYEKNPLVWIDLLRKIDPKLAEIIFYNMQAVLNLVLLPYRQLLFSQYEKGFQLFGIDLQPQADGNVLFIEANKSPDLNIKDNRDGQVKRTVVDEMYEFILTGHIGNNYMSLF